MKKLFTKILCFVVLIFATSLSMNAQCNYTFDWTDSYGDGWNGASVTISINGAVALTVSPSIDDGASGSETLVVNTGDAIEATFASGAWDGEIGYSFKDATGAVLVENNTTVGVVFTGTGSCPACTPATAAFTVVEDCAAGFTVEINVTDMGDATSYDVQSAGASIGTISATGVTTLGPFTNGTSVDLVLVHNVDTDCNVTRSGLVNPTTCPTETTVTCGATANTTHCYDNFDDNTFLFTAADGSSLLRMTINAGTTESGWDYLIVYDGSDATAPELYNADGDHTGISFNSTGTTLFVVVSSDGSNSCASGQQTTMDWDVECLTCDPILNDAPVIVDDCAAGTYTITVNVTAIGDGNSSITDGTTPQAITATGVYTFGPYLEENNTTLSVEHATDAICNAALGELSSSCPPANDLCADAIAITSPSTTAGTTVASTTTGEPVFCGTSVEAAGVWYTYESTVDEIVTVDICGAIHDSKMSVYTGSCGSFTCVTGEDDDFIICGGNDPSLEFTTNGSAGAETYYIYVNGYSGQTGTFDLNISSVIIPVNNDCPDAIDISDTTVFTGSTDGASDSNVTGCASNPDDDVWFTVTTDAEGADLTITVTGGVEYELFSGACGALASEGCNASPYTALSTGTQYWVRCYDPAVGFGGGSASRAISSFTIQAGGALLPIELTSFTGYADATINVLEFEVAAQENVAMFYVERSKDGVSNFEAVAETAAAGTTNELMSYRLIDETPLTMGYYRLVSKDFDGQMQTSNVIAIERPTDKFVVASVYPVPTNNSVFVEFDNDHDGDVQIVLTDVAGKQVLATQVMAINGNNKAEVNIASLSAGIYFMSLSNGESVIVERIIKN